MGFSVDDLKNSLLIMFQTQSNPNTMEQHFKDLAKIYDDYCKDSKDSIASNTLIVTGKSQFESIFSTYPSSSPSLTLYSTFIENACIAYWGACVFSVTNIPIGWTSLINISITPMTISSIKSTLEANFISAEGDATVLATNMANTIHSATNTVSLVLNGIVGISPITSPAVLKA